MVVGQVLLGYCLLVLVGLHPEVVELLLGGEVVDVVVQGAVGYVRGGEQLHVLDVGLLGDDQVVLAAVHQRVHPGLEQTNRVCPATGSLHELEHLPMNIHLHLQHMVVVLDPPTEQLFFPRDQLPEDREYLLHQLLDVHGQQVDRVDRRGV